VRAPLCQPFGRVTRQNLHMNGFTAYGYLLDTLPERPAIAVGVHAWGGPDLSDRIDAAIVELEPGAPGRSPTLALLLRSGAVRSILPTARERARGDLALYARRLAAPGHLKRVYLFARRLPDEATSRRLRRCGIELLAGPLGALGALTVVHGEPPGPSGRAQDAA